VIPELSFMVAPPEDPDGETERTFDFIRQVKKVNPDAEIIVYIYTPLPASSVPDASRLALAPLRDIPGNPVIFPRTPEEWTRRQWVDYACHADAPWMSDRLRRRVQDFVTVLTLPLSYRAGHAITSLGEGDTARARGLAIFAASLRSALGAARVAESRRFARSSYLEHLMRAPAINALQLSFFADARRRTGEQLLVDWHSLVDVAESAATAGVRINVIQASHEPGHIERNGVNYFFMAPPATGSLVGSPGFIARLNELAPQVIHIHGLGFARDVIALREVVPRTPLLLQDHADRPPHFWRRSYWRRGIAAANWCQLLRSRTGTRILASRSAAATR
jgi:hypothetical protein